MMPGGFGTLDEMFEVITLIQTRKIERVPIVLYSSSFWEPLLAWINSQLVTQGLIDEKDMNLFVLLDTPEDVVNYFKDYYHIDD